MAREEGWLNAVANANAVMSVARGTFMSHSLRRRSFSKGRCGQASAQAHGFDRGGGHNHHRSTFLDRFIQHVHRAQVQRNGVLLINRGSLFEFRRDFRFGLAKNDPRLAFTFRLRLA